MSEPFLAEIRMFAGTFAPKGWAACDGQLLPINQNTALFSLLGTTYGGDGKSTFALPDLRGRAPIHLGQGPDLPEVVQGEAGGNEPVTLQEAGQASVNRQPYLAVNFIIAMQGMFPSRAD